MPNPYAAVSGAQPDWMSAQPSPYQQQMMGQPMMAPQNTGFSDRQAAIGQQLANQPAQNMGGTRAGMGSGLGGAAMDPQKMAAGLRKLGDTVNPYLPTTQQATADQFGTNPYSDQSLMIAKQNQGLM